MPADLSAYTVKFALEILDAAPDEQRVRAAVEVLRRLLGPDGSLPVPGGTADERLTPAHAERSARHAQPRAVR
jgi:hypothetical protein